MKYDLSGKQKKLELDMFMEVISSSKLNYYSEYTQDFDYDDKITKRSNNDNWYDGEQKFNELVENAIKKLDLLGVKYKLNKIVSKETYEKVFRTYEISHYTYDILMTDPKFDYDFADLTYEQRAFCSLELVFLMMMHNAKLDVKILSNIFGMEVTYYMYHDIRNDISKVLNCKIEKNHKGRYKLIKEKYGL